MIKKRNTVKDYDAYMKASMDSGACVKMHSMAHMGKSYFYVSAEGIKEIEWTEMCDPKVWIDETTDTSDGEPK